MFDLLIGALIMTVVANGCTKLNLANWVQEIVTGCIIIAAVVVDRLRHRGQILKRPVTRSGPAYRAVLP